MTSDKLTPISQTLEKMPTGIEGFDMITYGGLPRNRTSLVVGRPGSGKTVFAMQTLVNGVHQWNEPGIFVTFEEPPHQIIANMASFGWDLSTLEQKGKLFFLDARLSVNDVQSGNFDLIGMLAILKEKANEMGAKRIVFDSIDVLLASLNDPIAERKELYRLHDWLSQAGPTGIITRRSEGGDPLLSQHYGFMQFMADCVVLLQQNMAERVSLRDLRVLKYRGSHFAESEFPLIIGPQGIEITSFGLEETEIEAPSERVSSGIERLDTMLDGGYFRGSSVLITGSPGTAKTTLCASFTQAACLRGEKTLYVSFDENAPEIVRNLSSVNIHLAPHVESGILKIYSEGFEAKSAEEHLMRIKMLIRKQKPRCMVIDPLSAMVQAGGRIAALGMAKELLLSAKVNGITIILTSLVVGGESMTETSGIAITTSSDTWIHLTFIAQSGERNRELTIIKSRGTGHSNQVRELILSDEGVTLTDVYTSKGEVLTGSLRWAKMRAEDLEKDYNRAEIERKRIDLELADAETLANMETLKRQLEAQRAKRALLNAQQKVQEEAWSKGKKDLGKLRDADKEV